MFGKKLDRFDRFTRRAREVLALAQKEAERLGHGYIGTEHLLIALVAESEGVAARVLHDAGVDLARVRGAVEMIVGRGSGDAREGRQVGLTPRAKRSIEMAVDEARRLKHKYIGTEHLLLGVARVEDGVGAGILDSLGCRLDDLRSRIVDMLGTLGVPDDAPGEPAATRDNVIACRVGDRELAAIDALVAAGARGTRSEAAAWLIRAGIEAKADLLGRVQETAGQIERLRRELNEAVREAAGEEALT